MKRFIFGKRSGIYVIDLEKTEQQLKSARVYLEEIASKGKQILFVGTKKQAKAILEFEAKRCGQPHVVNRWLGGTLTNFNTIRNNLNRYRDLLRQKEAGVFAKMSKKEAKRNERELAKLTDNYASLADLDGPPAVMFVVDPKREANAVHEANRLSIPIVAICDTNADPDLIAHPIPGNDDAIRSIRLITSMLADAIIAGRHKAGLSVPGDAPALDAAAEPVESSTRADGSPAASVGAV